ncbi:PREDICTED: MAM and LDL-receptor class A domain-containing protein 1-like [Branchiostoma belcheri]|uniref:MAM and LDL-receptor class A domain-containing protein 1-like n=1 Tax=Branchiostoma belcheri TaxID=7741 RepID=A0A6P4YJN7_BRABE|nr:PREDICTED: MAM and LDL-receptor class A domain-containing protein 1-like [Branchiostoma belcheri]
MGGCCYVWVMLLLLVAIVSGNTDPCMNHRTINQARRTSAASRVDPDLDICDIYLEKDWYRFTSYTGGEIPTSCVDVDSCSTEAPVWMNGSLPTTDAIVNRTACANLGFGTDCCTFSWDIRVKRCSDAHGLFYVYELEPTPSCPMAYCAGDLPLCPEGEVYDTFHQHCIETRPPVPCDFQDKGTCEWIQETDDDLNWAKGYGANAESTVLPSVDHTSGSDNGFYLFLQASASHQPFDTARIIGSVIVPSKTETCNVIIEGIIGYGRRSATAIDDISFSSGCTVDVDGNVRLVDGESFGEGRIEVYFNHEWGSICNSGWTKDNSDVICDQLGYGESQWFNSKYPASQGVPIHLDEVRCDPETHSKITECSHSRWGHHQPRCSHATDVSVRCLGFWHECLEIEFPCHNGVCVPLETYCDFNNDCGDTSDENSCNHYPARCSFQNGLCNWIQPKSDDTDWLRIRGSSGVSDQAPPTDHQARLDGYYMYIAGHLVNEGTKNAELLLPQYFSSNGSECKVLFHYYMTANVGELHLSIKTKDSIRRLWQQNTSQGNKWNKDQVTISSTEPFQVYFEGIVRAADTGSIAIDDVTLTPGCLIEITDCKLIEQSFQCESGECISNDLACNYEDNCVDSSDEGNPCDKEIGRCDFQEDFCSWSQDPDDDFDFVRGAETTDTENTGPVTDHTHKSPFGYYSYIEASRKQSGQTARLISPAYSNVTDCQFRFFYHMSGHHIGKLRVLLLNQENGRTKELWSLQGDQGRSWSYGSVSINREWGVYSVILEAEVGNGDQGDIAIDDISFATYCTPFRKDTSNGNILSTGASIGIGLGCCVALVVTVATVWLIYQRRRRSKNRASSCVNNQMSASEHAHVYETTEHASSRAREVQDTPAYTLGDLPTTQAQVPPLQARFPPNLSDKDDAIINSDGYARLLKNALPVHVASKGAQEVESKGRLNVDPALYKFVERHGFMEFLHIFAENNITLGYLVAATVTDLLNFGFPLPVASSILKHSREEFGIPEGHYTAPGRGSRPSSSSSSRPATPMTNVAI